VGGPSVHVAGLSGVPGQRQNGQPHRVPPSHGVTFRAAHAAALWRSPSRAALSFMKSTRVSRSIPQSLSLSSSRPTLSSDVGDHAEKLSPRSGSFTRSV